MQPTLEQLKGISLQAATRMSLATTAKTNEEITAEMGWTEAQQARFFQSHNFWPALSNLPLYCRIVGNHTLALWVSHGIFVGLHGKARGESHCSA